MSRHLVLVTLLITAAAVAGCRPKNPPPPPPPRISPASPQQIDAIRAAARQVHPDSDVGVIIAARPQDRLVAVSGLDVSKISVDQVVTFMDASQSPLGSGRVVRIVDQTVHVRYDPPTGPYDPTVGDLMVRF